MEKENKPSRRWQTTKTRRLPLYLRLRRPPLLPSLPFPPSCRSLPRPLPPTPERAPAAGPGRDTLKMRSFFPRNPPGARPTRPSSASRRRSLCFSMPPRALRGCRSWAKARPKEDQAKARTRTRRKLPTRPRTFSLLTAPPRTTCPRSSPGLPEQPTPQLMPLMPLTRLLLPHPHPLC